MHFVSDSKPIVVIISMYVWVILSPKGFVKIEWGAKKKNLLESLENIDQELEVNIKRNALVHVII